MREAGVLDHWLPECAGATRLRALIAREDKPDPLRRLAAILPADADATAIGKRLKLSTQEALRLEVMLAREPVIDVAGGPKAWRAQIYAPGRQSLRRSPAARGRGAGRLAGGARDGAQLDAARTAGERRRCAEARPQARARKSARLIEAVERWWIDGDFTADRAACLAELERLAARA